jgi:hypothetical protein
MEQKDEVLWVVDKALDYLELLRRLIDPQARYSVLVQRVLDD